MRVRRILRRRPDALRPARQSVSTRRPTKLAGLSDSRLPNLNLGFQLDAEPFLHSGTNVLHQLYDVAAGGLFIGDDVVGVPVAHFGAADASRLQPGLFDERSGVHAARVLEDA